MTFGLGCSPATDDDRGAGSAHRPGADAGELAPAGIGANGINLNGLNLNGINLNGLNLNGINLNGINLNGLHLNGINLNGLNLNGLHLNGINLNGWRLNGVKLNGLHLNGMLNGQLLHGAKLEGVKINGLRAKGSMLYAIVAPGVYALAEGLDDAQGQPLAQAGDTVEILGGADAGEAWVSVKDILAPGTGVTDAATGGNAVCAGGVERALLLSLRSGEQAFTLRIKGVQRVAGPDDDTGVFTYSVDFAAGSVSDCEGVNAPGWQPLGGHDEAGAPEDVYLVPGNWDAQTGAKDSSGGPSVFTWASRHGAIGACVAWGYQPWPMQVTRSDLGGNLVTDVQDFSAQHQACTRMKRADYCGDGTSWTVTGTTIDVADRVQLQASERPDWLHEANWSPDGATCVTSTRIDTLAQLGAVPGCLAALQAHPCPDVDDPAATDLGGALLETRVEAGYNYQPENGGDTKP